MPALLVLQFLATGVFAADTLQVDLSSVGLRARNEAPVPVEVRFKWDSARILEGRLDMEFLEGNRILGRYRSGDLALTGGEQSFRMLLPPSLKPFSDSQVTVKMKFVNGATAIELEPSSLFMPVMGERSLALGWCDAGTAATEASSDIIRNLVFEKFAPPADDVSRRLLSTSVARLTPEDLPAQPLAYTSFDVVVLTAEAFKEAGERQLQALARWVRGGGSVCVFVAGGLQPHHVSFLNQLDDSVGGGPAFLTDNGGNLLPAQNRILRLYSGLGRSVIVAGDNLAEADPAPSEWRQIATFLWKMRGDQARAITVSGHWEIPVNPSMENNSIVRTGQFSRNGPYYVEPLSYSVQPTDLGAELLGRLMPKTVRLIPFSALIGTLALFVLLIGPADYFVLGFFRRRKLTWILFPATSIAFTVATVLMANHYLGLRDQRCSLIVVDLARDGTALRWNRYELIFTARDKQSVTELKDALWAPLEIQPTTGQFNNSYAYNQPYGYRRDPGREASPPLYYGTLPVHYQTSESIRQWQPELNRILSFEPPPVSLIPNWPAVEGAWPDLSKVRAKLSEKRTFHGDLCSISAHNSVTTDSGSIGILPAEVLSELCVGNSRGMMSLISQVSPTGGGNFEDAPAMDMKANDSMLAIVTQSGDDIIVYRRFFYGN